MPLVHDAVAHTRIDPDVRAEYSVQYSTTDGSIWSRSWLSYQSRLDIVTGGKGSHPTFEEASQNIDDVIHSSLLTWLHVQ